MIIIDSIVIKKKIKCKLLHLVPTTHAFETSQSFGRFILNTNRSETRRMKRNEKKKKKTVITVYCSCEDSI